MSEQPQLSERQRQGNRKIALTLGLIAIAIFISYIARQWQAGN